MIINNFSYLALKSAGGIRAEIECFFSYSIMRQLHLTFVYLEEIEFSKS